MKIIYGKKIDSSRLKTSVDKSQSIQASKAISTSISPGARICACPVCFGRETVSLTTVYRFEYVKCKSCETAYVVNPPDQDDLEGIYSSEYYTAANRKLYANEEILTYRLDNIAGPKVDFVLDNISPRPASWLDIGCGTGEILKSAQDRGLRVAGVETNEMQRDFAKAQFNIDVLGEFVTPQNIGKLGASFDVISLFSILEHVLDPNALVAGIAALQGKQATLVIEVPHYPSISSLTQSVFPELVNRMMHPPLHLFLFSLEGLKRLLTRHGYEITHCWFFGQDQYEFITTMFLVVPQLNNSDLAKALMPLVSECQKVIDEHGLSDEMLLIAKKTSE